VSNTDVDLLLKSQLKIKIQDLLKEPGRIRNWELNDGEISNEKKGVSK